MYNMNDTINLRESQGVLALDCHNTLGEGIIWDQREKRVVWVDIEGGYVWGYTPTTGKTWKIKTMERPCTLGLLE
eukprot:Ihof_evm7s251 gene=Ihof_evmTU7s251